MPTHPERVGLSSTRLRKIDQFLKTRYVDAGKLPGTLLLIMRRGQVAHLSVLGQMDVERRRPLQEDAIFRIYSMTKPITSVAFMMLVEEGLVALDDPVDRHIPSWRDLGVYKAGFMGAFRAERPQRPMLIVDLLRHTSGLTYGFQMRTNVDAAYRQLRVGEMGASQTLQTMIEHLAMLPLEFSPGTAWNYSVSTDVLGYLIGKLSGMPFAEFLKTRIFDPLGMQDTAFHVPAEKAARLAACYQLTPGGKVILQDDPTTSQYLAPPEFVSGGGGLVSTARDYLQFCKMLLGRGSLDGVQLLSPKTLELMIRNHLPDGKELAQFSTGLFNEAAYAGLGFGLGFATTLDGARALIPGTPGDASWGGMASTFFWIDPAEQLAAILMTQLIPSTAYSIRRELRTLVYSAFTE
jgi:CubicO group peptidase (beta-lactamase class C family)